MSSSTKTKLKAARDALGKKCYEEARDAAFQVLDYEPNNYNAHVFLGLAFLELGQHDKSEQYYRKAIELKTDQILGWQASDCISQLYERSSRWDALSEALQHMMQMFATTGDAIKCAETLQKLVSTRRDHGTRQQVVSALYYLLPDSPLYATLSTLPSPDPTNPTSTSTFDTQTAIHNSLPVIEEIISISERDEEAVIKNEFDKRRTRLGGPSPDQLKRDIGVEVWGASKLPSIYQEVLNHPSTSDDLRRSTEAKLIRYKQQYFYALPTTSSEKDTLGLELDELINGVVIIGVPMTFPAGYGLDYLRQYMRLLPATPLARLLKGYFLYTGTPIFEEDEGENDDEHAKITPEDKDSFDTIMDTFGSLSDSILASRIVTEVYLQELDYTSVINIAESGLELVRRHEKDTGRKICQVRKAFQVGLATALVHLYPPKHHARALRLLDDVLNLDPNNVDALIGRGYILQHARKWEEAEVLFAKAVSLVPVGAEKSVRAKEESAWCLSRSRVEHGVQELKDVLNDLEAEFRHEAFSHFINSLKSDRTYAPSYTSLGIYYSEFADPPDPNRASKCFQKAFELDPREADAARRLAEGFADEREWDLVEVVARRTIDGEGGLDAGIQTGDGVVVGRYLPTNAWAWKAVGVVELTRRNYAPSIDAFQVALRADPEDQLLWLRLGEAYSKAGRHAAALRALARAHDLEARRLDVHRQTSRLVEAFCSFESILEVRPKEIGVLMSLAQTQLDLARQERFSGFSARAEQSFLAAITTCHTMSQESSGYGGVAWKVAADSLFGLSKTTAFVDEDNVREVLSRTNSLLRGHASTRIARAFSPTSATDEVPLTGRHALEAAVAAYDYRITVSSTEDIAMGSALFDLGIALYAWSTEDKSSGHQLASETATSLLKQALQKEPGNASYWNALGSMYFMDKPKAAQHAYVKALEHDTKILDPDYTLAWVGQALVATANGDDSDARTLFEHAVSLTADVVSGGRDNEELLPAFFVLNRYVKRCPRDPCALHLLGLLCERLGQIEQGAEWISRAITLLEAVYEETEDPLVERQFTIAHANLARLRVGLCDHAGALESFETALGLLAVESPDDDSETKVLRVQTLFGSGLAHFKLGDLQSAMTTFQSALDCSGEDQLLRGHVTVLLAQAMWAIGTDEFKESAKAVLLDCISTDPENLMAINTLAGMGILTEDDNLIQSLPIERRQELDPGRDVTYLLVQHHLSQSDVEQATRIAQKALHIEPSNLQLRPSDLPTTQAMLEIHSLEENITEAKETLDLAAIAGKGKEALRCAQKSVMLDPGRLQSWRTLAYVRAREAS
ncbi:superkiller protein 3 [Melanogaster broomeanus]|nr:superkiller protein 3 [Melanogaster broomeanus]